MSVVRRVTVHLVLLMFLARAICRCISATSKLKRNQQKSNDPLDIWSKDYIDDVYPWGGDDAAQFKEYHTYFTMKDRMQHLAENNRNIMTFHEGLNGGVECSGPDDNSEHIRGMVLQSHAARG
ncbi:MAG: hypothetical protein ACJZ59_07795 [Candidatus Thalassarchaeaceae archaeon]